MKDLSQYNLIFYRLEEKENPDRKIFRGKRTSGSDYVIIDPVSLVKRLMTAAELRKEFYSDKSNKSKRLKITKRKAA